MRDFLDLSNTIDMVGLGSLKRERVSETVPMFPDTEGANCDSSVVGNFVKFDT